MDIFKPLRLLSCKLLNTHRKVTKHDDCIGVAGHWSCDDCGLDSPAIKWPRMPNVKPPKTDFTEMCQSCFGSMISKMPLRTICNLQEVERQRMLGCSHRAKPVGPKNTKLNGDPIDCHKCDCGDNEPDFTVTPPKVDMGDYHD